MRRYPTSPGFKERGGTSEDAARAVDGKAATLRKAVLATLGRRGDLTADEAARDMAESVLSIRPRFSELAAEGLIVKTAARRPNASGHSAAVWRLTATTSQPANL